MKCLRVLNALFIYILCLVLLSGFWYQFSHHKEPCPLCLLQRLSMIGVATALVMNLRFGIKVQHYGLAILCALLGRLISLQHISLHLCPSFPSYNEAVLGFNLYIWAFIVFNCSIFSCAVLLILQGALKISDEHFEWQLFEKGAAGLTLLIATANLVNALLDCGLSLCT